MRAAEIQLPEGVLPDGQICEMAQRNVLSIRKKDKNLSASDILYADRWIFSVIGKNKIADLYSSGADPIFHYTMASSVSQDEK